MFIFLGGLFNLANADWNPDWKSLKSETGWQLDRTVQSKLMGPIRIQVKEIDGNPCFKGSANVNDLSPTALLRIVTDIPGTVDWSSSGIRDSKLLSSEQHSFDYYQYLDIPFLSDRFWFLRGTLEHDGNSRLFRWEKLTQGGPHSEFFRTVRKQNPGAVEPPVNLGAWNFEAQDGGTAMSYFICTHPGGSIPNSLQSIGTARTLPGNLEDVVRAARKSDGS